MKRLALLLALTGAITLFSAAPASALYHLMKIREVSPETAPGAKDAFVELQMYAPDQQHVGAHTIDFWKAAGTEKHNRALFGPDPPNGQTQRTILIGDVNTPGRDFTVNLLSQEIEAAGGAVCFDFTKVDCVSWGTFVNGASPDGTLPVGTNAPAIPAGSSLTRSISRGCAAALDPADDTNNSAADFSVTARTPRPNSTAPTETPCGGGGGGGGGRDRNPPQTTFTRRPPNRSGDRTPTFRFRSDEARSTFQCKLDGRRYKPCTSPLTTRRLSFGSHTLRVRARDRAGNRDATPAKDTFRIVRR